MNLNMENEDHAFYVVRKGDIVAVYKSLSDCQAQVSPSVCGPPVSVYKGYFMSKETEEYLAARGLKNASYTINQADVNEDLIKSLVPCSFQEVTSLTSASTEGSKKPLTFDLTKEAEPLSPNPILCFLEFDGASKGNPGKAGAGAILRTGDGQLFRLREGLGIVTNNVAEYRSLILGLKFALNKGFKRICVTGDSQLVCMQVQGLWQTKHRNMIELCSEVKQLKNNFQSFQISHVKREFNSRADAEANLAINLPAGQIIEEKGRA